MKKFLILFVALTCLAGCSAPRYSGNAITQKLTPNEVTVEIIHDADTRSGFQKAMESWLRKNNFKYVVKSEHTKHDLDKLTLEYSGRWGWDLALYLNDANIEAFHEGQRVGKVEFKAPNSLNGKKFGNAEERIEKMMNVLFSQQSIIDANNSL